MKLEKETTRRTQRALGTWIRSWDFILQVIQEPLNNNKIIN